MIKDINIKYWLCATSEYPILLVYGVIYHDNKLCGEFPHYFPYSGEWGDRIEDAEPVISGCGQVLLNILWYSIKENKFYYFEKDFTIESSINAELLIGLYPKGEIALWEYSITQSKLLGYDIGVNNSENVLSMIESNSSIVKLLDPFETSFEDLQSHYIDFLSNNNFIFDKDELTISKISDTYMYKFQHNLMYNDIELELDNFDIKFFDGSHLLSLFREISTYKKRALPKRIRIKCHIGKYIFELYFRFFFNEILSIIKRFFGIHHDTKSDLIVKIDVENKNFELALYRQGLKELVVIPESAYQLIVFKNKFEDYRSENYNQPRGAWVW
ncbi:MAG: hypothetical protein HDS13_06885 [Bacteroides sp.]|nr:hypothetical protein [Bacteroides sp.]